MIRGLMKTLLLVQLCTACSAAWARTWTDASGSFKVEADLIALSPERVVLRTTKNKLLSLDVKQLSPEDQKFLSTAEASADRLADPDKNHVWQLQQKELKLIGRMQGYYEQDFVIERAQSRLVVNGKKETELPELLVKVIPAIVENFEHAGITDSVSLNKWLTKQGKTQHKYHVDGVRLLLDSGIELNVPIFLFGPQEREFLMPGLERWRAIQNEKLEQVKKEELERQEKMMMQASARAYQQNQAIQTRAQVMQLELLAVTSGATELWEVELMPAARYGYPFTVVVPARNSQVAEQTALQRYPGNRITGTRKFAGY